MKRLLLLLTLSCLLTTLTAQTDLPIIHAQSDQVDIRVGDAFYEETWTIMPEYRPDPYLSSALGEEITFYTDMDSISVTLEANTEFDFVILLNGQDSAFTRISYEPSKLDILRTAALYDDSEEAVFPEWTYQSADAPELVALREGFKLDSIAGGGNEVSKMINIMHWLHDLVTHDGGSGNPAVRNAMSLINTCRDEGRGLNCRGLSIVLNECYLAMGFKSRYITCMPRDSVFQDCHVINMVWSEDLNKWLWMDPTQNACIMDETGTLLSIQEVRARLINGERLILNPDANWNRQNTTSVEWYLEYYMAKNLYRMECPIASQSDYETLEDGREVRYLELLPVEDYARETEAIIPNESDDEIKFYKYFTRNPDWFWANPYETTRR